jgi:hypothetical protein
LIGNPPDIHNRADEKTANLVVQRARQCAFLSLDVDERLLESRGQRRRIDTRCQR